MRGTVLLVPLLLAALSGCLGGEEPGADDVIVEPLPSRAYRTDGPWSYTLAPGPYAELPAEVVTVPDHLGDDISMGLYRPDVPEGVRVPVIVDAGPYYGEDDEPNVDSRPDKRLAAFLIDNFVPHGYAVALLSVRGTGWSGGCMDFMGPDEQEALDLAITWLGEQAWSNGNVAMIGRSYDGTTPWEVAARGNPHLKTIVPISGLSDVFGLVFHNGSAEARGPGLLWALYQAYTVERDRMPGPWTAGMACPGSAPAVPMNVGAYVTGNRMDAAHDYWTVRDFRERVEANYNGSVFLVHGLQDWNVEGTMAYPFLNELDVPTKALLGQWGHHYPDRPGEHRHLRWDWAESLLAWFDRWLKESETIETGPAVEVQDDHGSWRTETDWPPADADWTTYHLGAESLAAGPGEAGRAPLAPYAGYAYEGADVEPTQVARFRTEPLPAELRFAGLPRLHVTVTPTGPGGHLFAQLFDEDDAGTRAPIGHAWMDLRYHEGGDELQAVVPGMPIVAKMEFFPLDVVLPAGHRLVLEITGETVRGARSGPLPEPLPSPVPSGVVVEWGDGKSVLKLPLIERAECGCFFAPPK